MAQPINPMVTATLCVGGLCATGAMVVSGVTPTHVNDLLTWKSGAFLFAGIWTAVTGYFSVVAAIGPKAATRQSVDHAVAHLATRDDIERLGATVRDQGVTEKQVFVVVTALLDQGLTLEQAEALLPKSIAELRALSDRLGRLSNDEPDIVAKREMARAAIDEADLERADRLLSEAEDLDRRAGQRRLLRAAESAAERGALARSQAQFLKAAEHYGRAAHDAAPFDAEQAWSHHLTQADVLCDHGRLFPGLGSLRQAIHILRSHCLPHATREAMPAQWAGTQNNLGNALCTLGERAGGAAGIEALDQAVAAYLGAIAEFNEMDADHYTQITRNGLSKAQALLVQLRS